MPEPPQVPDRHGQPQGEDGLRSGNISGWDLNRQLAVAASLGLRARIVLKPA